VSPVRYELGFYITGDGILNSHRLKTSNLMFYKGIVVGILREYQGLPVSVQKLIT
jgi:hypothetical protein